jgi:hypothetical protein
VGRVQVEPARERGTCYGATREHQRLIKQLKLEKSHADGPADLGEPGAGRQPGGADELSAVRPPQRRA